LYRLQTTYYQTLARTPGLSIEHILGEDSIETSAAPESRLMSMLTVMPSKDPRPRSTNLSDENLHDRLHE
jgi:hypothetical protein